MESDLESVHKKKPAVSEDGHVDQQHSDSGREAIEQDSKENVVDWDGPEDPKNPRNWPTWKRMTQVVLASAFLLTAYDISAASLKKQVQC